MPRTRLSNRRELIDELQETTLAVFQWEWGIQQHLVGIIQFITENLANQTALDDVELITVGTLVPIIGAINGSLSGPMVELLGELESKRYLSREACRAPRKDTREQAMAFFYGLDPKTFHIFFRMTRSMFDELLAGISSHPVFHRGGSNPQLPVQYQLMAALNRMGHDGNAASVRYMASVFHIGDGTVQNFTLRVQVAIVETYGDTAICWPDEQERRELSLKQLTKAMLPGCIGYVDGSLFPLRYRPSKDGNAYWTRKFMYAINVMVVCDIDRRIRYVHTGFCGSANDARVMAGTSLGQTPELFFGNTDDPEKNYYLLGDSGYTPTPYVVPMFKASSNGRAQTKNQNDFNQVMAGQRVRVEHVFGMLKMRWGSLGCLRNQMGKELDAARVNLWIVSLVVLHNLMLHEPQLSQEDLEERAPQFIAAREEAARYNIDQAVMCDADGDSQPSRGTVSAGAKKRAEIMSTWDHFRKMHVSHVAR